MKFSTALTIMAFVAVSQLPMRSMASKSDLPPVLTLSPSEWTTEQYLNARPMPLPQTKAALLNIQDDSGVKADAKPRTGKAKAPDPTIKVDERTRIYPAGSRPRFIDEEELSAPLPEVQGSNGPYTSARLTPLTADRTLPYRAVGTLFFNGECDPNHAGREECTCTGFVIQQRIVATAGHCIHDGSGTTAGYFTNLRFMPAFRDGASPYSIWPASNIQTSSAWYNGGGTTPNAADWAMLVVPDQNIGGTTKKISALTGYLGYQLGVGSPNNIVMVGYPINLDNAMKMHQVFTTSYCNNLGICQTCGDNTCVSYPSDMKGGSSGGPWIMNFGSAGSGSVPPNTTLKARNTIVGITSYGAISTSIQLQGAPILTEGFTDILDNLCDLTEGNCSSNP